MLVLRGVFLGFNIFLKKAARSAHLLHAVELELIARLLLVTGLGHSWNPFVNVSIAKLTLWHCLSRYIVQISSITCYHNLF